MPTMIKKCFVFSCIRSYSREEIITAVLVNKKIREEMGKQRPVDIFNSSLVTLELLLREK